MKTNFHKYCYTTESNNGSTIIVRFSNNKELLKIAKHEKLIRDVVWYIKDGSLCIDGYEDDVHFTDRIKLVSELKQRPSEEDIKKDKGLKIFGFTLIEPCEYIKGWYRYPGKNRLKVILTNYSIKIYD